MFAPDQLFLARVLRLPVDGRVRRGDNGPRSCCERKGAFFTPSPVCPREDEEGNTQAYMESLLLAQCHGRMPHLGGAAFPRVPSVSSRDRGIAAPEDDNPTKVRVRAETPVTSPRHEFRLASPPPVLNSILEPQNMLPNQSSGNRLFSFFHSAHLVERIQSIATLQWAASVLDDSLFFLQHGVGIISEPERKGSDADTSETTATMSIDSKQEHAERRCYDADEEITHRGANNAAENDYPHEVLLEDEHEHEYADDDGFDWGIYDRHSEHWSLGNAETRLCRSDAVMGRPPRSNSLAHHQKYMTTQPRQTTGGQIWLPARDHGLELGRRFGGSIGPALKQPFRVLPLDNKPLETIIEDPRDTIPFEFSY